MTRIRENAGELNGRFSVTCIAVFGSLARGEQTADSDVDLIVEVARPTPENVFGSERRLSQILGRKVEAGSFDSLRPRIGPLVARELVDVWSA